MSNARRHYRVAQKEVAKEKENENTVKIPGKHKKLVVAGLISFMILVFVKGIVIGYYFGKRSD